MGLPDEWDTESKTDGKVGFSADGLKVVVIAGGICWLILIAIIVAKVMI